jgi:hypothetical protein
VTLLRFTTFWPLPGKFESDAKAYFRDNRSFKIWHTLSRNHRYPTARVDQHLRIGEDFDVVENSMRPIGLGALKATFPSRQQIPF